MHPLAVSHFLGSGDSVTERPLCPAHTRNGGKAQGSLWPTFERCHPHPQVLAQGAKSRPKQKNQLSSEPDPQLSGLKCREPTKPALCDKQGRYRLKASLMPALKSLPEQHCSCNQGAAARTFISERAVHVPVYKKTDMKCSQRSEIHYQGFFRNKNIPNKANI